ncbi:hypothetical protein Val02_02020 [Virgisporangium aliadipatigenens]|uniref:HTH marR-type domain-containing protein n=1 Tax=Virgisporangium aliadipatigenens TaxID=741659 RepID=A0A8J4DN03_9ACTN|nr:MarR family transcriptional regulator [Virgisporangium aliadipatigenens]GIJ43316.1 hypothetical protein Val02_02020 [Virgisporangium aliadipatigenens]
MAFDTLEDALVQCAFSVIGTVTHLGAVNDLSLTQLRVIGTLRDRRCHVTELADLCGLDKSTMSTLVDRAAKRGLVATDRNAEDRRMLDVFLTPAGRELAWQLTEQANEILKHTTNVLDEAQREALRALLEVVFRPASAVA